MEKIIVLDFGGQYTHLLARRIRQLNVYSEIMSPEEDIDKLKDAKGIILSGGPSSVYDKDAPAYNKEIFNLNIPILGLCYGHQLMANTLGGEVKQGKTKEYGLATIDVKNKDSLFKDVNSKEVVWMSHGDMIAKLPEGFEIIGTTSECESAAIADTDRKYFGFQFHPEVTHTPNGIKMLENFVNVCGCKRDWTMHSYIDNTIKEIKEKVDGKKVFLLVSGGVDSTVAFALLNKALDPENVYGLHIDNGLMRKDEASEVKAVLEKHGFNNFHVDDSSQVFLDKLKDKFEPEEKRKIIGTVFLEVADNATKKLNLNPDEWILGQGTIYPDTIETGGTKNAAVIKTHHNRVEAVQKLIDEGKIIEPIAQLYKDEVREVGLELGLPEELVWRHPFPGPGLGVRVLCSDGSDSIENEAEINEKINEITKKHNLKGRVIPIKSVGVQGDSRTYAHPAVIIGRSDWETLEKVSTDITNNIKEINRVVYLLKPEDIGEIKINKAYLTKDRLDTARDADFIAMSLIQERRLSEEIWQMPTVLVPLKINSGECIILRPVASKEAMTAQFSKLPIDVVEEIAEQINKLDNVDAVFYDITHKPPGTIEWE